MKKVDLNVVFHSTLIAICFGSLGMLKNYNISFSDIKLSTVTEEIAFSVSDSKSNKLSGNQVTSITKNANCHQFTIERLGSEFITSTHCLRKVENIDLKNSEYPTLLKSQDSIEFDVPTVSTGLLKVIDNNKIINIPILISDINSCSFHYSIKDKNDDVRQGDSGTVITDLDGNAIGVNYGLDALTLLSDKNNLKRSKKGYASFKKCE